MLLVDLAARGQPPASTPVWYHLGLAEQYVVHGGVVRFPEAPAVATVSHLATWLYTWALLMPWGELGAPRAARATDSAS